MRSPSPSHSATLLQKVVCRYIREQGGRNLAHISYTAIEVQPRVPPYRIWELTKTYQMTLSLVITFIEWTSPPSKTLRIANAGLWREKGKHCRRVLLEHCYIDRYRVQSIFILLLYRRLICLVWDQNDIPKASRNAKIQSEKLPCYSR